MKWLEWMYGTLLNYNMPETFESIFYLFNKFSSVNQNVVNHLYYSLDLIRYLKGDVCYLKNEIKETMEYYRKLATRNPDTLENFKEKLDQFKEEIHEIKLKHHQWNRMASSNEIEMPDSGANLGPGQIPLLET